MHCPIDKDVLCFGFSRQGSSDAPSMFNKDRVSNLQTQGVNGGGYLLPTCTKYGRKHEGKSLEGSNACFGCGKMDHNIRDYPSDAKNEEDNSRRAQTNPSHFPSVLGPCASSHNRFTNFKLLMTTRVLLLWKPIY